MGLFSAVERVIACARSRPQCAADQQRSARLHVTVVMAVAVAVVVIVVVPVTAGRRRVARMPGVQRAV